MFKYTKILVFVELYPNFYKIIIFSSAKKLSCFIYIYIYMGVLWVNCSMGDGGNMFRTFVVCCLNVCCWCRWSLVCLNGCNEMFRILVLFCIRLYYTGIRCWCWWPSVVLLGWFLLFGVLWWAHWSCSVVGSLVIICGGLTGHVLWWAHWSCSMMGSLVMFLFAVLS
jgi:hypothetical protein